MAAPPPPPHPVAARIFASYVRRLARRHFAAVHWNGGAGADPGARRPQGPSLFVANHPNWWDGVLACLVTARLGLDFQILMDAANLDRYPLFRRVGALPMHRDSPTRAWDDLAAAAAHLRRPAAALWVFPQGRGGLPRSGSPGRSAGRPSSVRGTTPRSPSGRSPSATRTLGSSRRRRSPGWGSR